MDTAKQILYVTRGLEKDFEGIDQALSLASANNGEVIFLIHHPILPKDLLSYQSAYEQSLKDTLTQHIKSTAEQHNIKNVEYSIQVASYKIPCHGIIQAAIDQTVDLVMKQAEVDSQSKGFKSFDIELLRQCHCPVWLFKPEAKPHGQLKMAVAVDPSDTEASGMALSIKLLQKSEKLAQSLNAKLDILACWDFENEDQLRNNAWLKIPEDEITQAILGEKKHAEDNLNNIIGQANLQIAHNVNLVKGTPELQIPAFVESDQVDILVMGTVARTGIPGFLMGNTSESILRKVDCTLVAFKPDGFTSSFK